MDQPCKTCHKDLFNDELILMVACKLIVIIIHYWLLVSFFNMLFKYHSVFKMNFRGIIIFFFPLKNVFVYVVKLMLLACKGGAHSFHITSLNIYMTKVKYSCLKLYFVSCSNSKVWPSVWSIIPPTTNHWTKDNNKGGSRISSYGATGEGRTKKIAA